MNNIYLIVSKSFKLIKKEIELIIGDNNLLLFNAEKNLIEELLAEISYPSLEQNKKYVLIKNAYFLTNIKEPTINLNNLINYLNNPDESVILIFISDSIDNRKKIVKLIKEKYKFINYEINYKNIYNYLSMYAKENKYNLDYETTNYLVKIYGLNYDLQVNELDKLFLYYEKPGNIYFNIAKEIISKPTSDNNFKFIESVVNKDIEKIYEYLNDLKVYKTDPITLIILLARQFRLIFYVKKMFGENKKLKEVMSFLNMADWQINKLYKESFNFTEKEILKNINTLAIMDEKIKSGKIDKEIALNTVLLEIIG